MTYWLHYNVCELTCRFTFVWHGDCFFGSVQHATGLPVHHPCTVHHPCPPKKGGLGHDSCVHGHGKKEMWKQPCTRVNCVQDHHAKTNPSGLIQSMAVHGTRWIWSLFAPLMLKTTCILIKKTCALMCSTLATTTTRFLLLCLRSLQTNSVHIDTFHIGPCTTSMHGNGTTSLMWKLARGVEGRGKESCPGTLRSNYG